MARGEWVRDKPNGGSDYEFIELRNLSTTTALDLTPVTISGGVDYAFPSMSLATGARIIVPKNLAVFQSRYGTALPTVAGWGPNDSLNNSGDTITLNYGQESFSCGSGWCGETLPRHRNVALRQSPPHSRTAQLSRHQSPSTHGSTVRLMLLENLLCVGLLLPSDIHPVECLANPEVSRGG